MKIYFARHGRSNYNDRRLCNADPAVNVYLTPVGEEQAKMLALTLMDIKIEHIFVSELKRTQQTAKIINEFHCAPIEVDPLLNDHRSGFEGKPFPMLKKALDAAGNRWTVRFNDGESIEDMKERVAAFLDELRTKPYEIVLVVTSQWIVRAAVALVQGLNNEDAWKLEVEQGSYLELEV